MTKDLQVQLWKLESEKSFQTRTKTCGQKQGYVYNNIKTNGIRFARKYEVKTDSE